MADTRNLHGGRLKDWVFRFFQPPTDHLQRDLPFDDAGKVERERLRRQLSVLADHADEVERRLAASVDVRLRHHHTAKGSGI